MHDPAALLAAFDRAIARVDTLLVEGARTRDGGDAGPALAGLRTDLVARREAAASGAGVERAWVAQAVRAVAAWTPDEELPLIAALGALARLATA